MLFTLIATAILSAATLAQDKVEYGDIKELAGKTKVFVQSDDLEGRKQIVKELSGKKGLVIVERSEDAEFTLLYKSSESEAGSIYRADQIA